MFFKKEWEGKRKQHLGRKWICQNGVESRDIAENACLNVLRGLSCCKQETQNSKDSLIELWITHHGVHFRVEPKEEWVVLANFSCYSWWKLNLLGLELNNSLTTEQMFEDLADSGKFSCFHSHLWLKIDNPCSLFDSQCEKVLSLTVNPDDLKGHLFPVHPLHPHD